MSKQLPGEIYSILFGFRLEVDVRFSLQSFHCGLYQDDDTCGYYWWEGAYVKYLQTRKMRELEMAEEEHQTGEEQMMEMRQQLCQLKKQMEELKQQVCHGKLFVLSNAVLASACVGVVVGLVMGLVWK